ncbi:SDR family NAD(P)-dependent oxidoreductase [Phyllobacterium leguminum]|uniref:NAD(P)-dependent dehydrogenase (Short-subunit alcohol dehydrogenase family) n=1 Tax=Phyllobacterium leguminum TaxID=314237 RepID=A0A318TA60_9HYPH|nr:3-oxoacyl-ACP reductase family protein [Phyllobacterium leguminum]PYE90547.1 NAD(P)-dependent dehydrogenase (short-subunit alcohol dehydrogenase family) [Phyllobacterium leguminum]
MSGLQGKVALVTGGSRGMGAAIARRLAADGADVALTYARSPEKATSVAADIQKIGRRALAIQADNRDAAAIEAAVAKTVEELGRLDILVNNAGIFSVAPIEDVTLEAYDEMMAINTRAVFVAIKAVVPHLPEGGRIITISSNLAEQVPFAGVSLYAASKAALTGLTKGVARDLGPKRITVNLVQPGSTDTDMNPADSDHADAQRERMAIQSYSTPQDVAGLVAWLASEEARFVTGATLVIDSGANI